MTEETIQTVNQRVRDLLLKCDSRFIAIVNNNCVKILEEREKRYPVKCPRFEEWEVT